MGTEVWVKRQWRASKTCTVVLLEGAAYVRYNDGHESALEIRQEVALEEGNEIWSVQGCKIEVKDS